MVCSCLSQEVTVCPSDDDFKPCTCREFSGLYIQCVYSDLKTIMTAVRSHIKDVPVKRLVIRKGTVHKIPRNAFKGLSIEQLYVVDSQVREIHQQAFKSIASSLRMLYLNNNELTSVPNAFQELSGVVTLYLNNNQIGTIEPGSFSGMTNLTYLWLNDNKIKQLLPDTFTGLATLAHLRLQENSIELICPGAFDGMPLVELLRLDSNNLTTLSEETFNTSVLHHLNDVRLSDNPIVCDCRLKWIATAEFGVRGTCAAPDNMADKEIVSPSTPWMFMVCSDIQTKDDSHESICFPKPESEPEKEPLPDDGRGKPVPEAESEGTPGKETSKDGNKNAASAIVSSTLLVLAAKLLHSGL